MVRRLIEALALCHNVNVTLDAGDEEYQVLSCRACRDTGRESPRACRHRECVCVSKRMRDAHMYVCVCVPPSHVHVSVCVPLSLNTQTHTR